MKIGHTIGIILGFIGIFLLDLGFNGSAASDLFFPPQLRKALPPPIANASLPPPPAPPAGLAGYMPAGQNIYFYIIGGIFLAAGMLLLIVSARKTRHESFSGREAPSPGETKKK